LISLDILFMPFPSFTPWSNSLKTRACRQLIHHYLGVFFQEKLSLDQLSIDLFSGRGQVKDIALNLNVTSCRDERYHRLVSQ
jgi:hypothetical protein